MKQTFELEILKKYSPRGKPNLLFPAWNGFNFTMERDGSWLFHILGIEWKSFMKVFFLFFNSLKGSKVQRNYKETSSEYFHFCPLPLYQDLKGDIKGVDNNSLGFSFVWISYFILTWDYCHFIFWVNSAIVTKYKLCKCHT